MRARRYAFSLVLAIAGFDASAAPGVVTTERTETYDVRGVDAATLTRQMAERGPVHQGQRAWAYTDWEVRSRYTPVAARGGCRIEAVQLQLDIVTTLPRWRMSPAADARLRARWARLQASLVAHEQAHREHALDAARAAHARLAALPAEADCDLAALRA